MDTHALLWAASDADRLGPGLNAALANRDDRLLSSDVGLLEIALKVGSGNLRFNPSLGHFTQGEVERNGYRRLPINSRHILATISLPRLHLDPFDRPLVAHCLEEDLVLATVDAAIRRYPVRTIW